MFRLCRLDALAGHRAHPRRHAPARWFRIKYPFCRQEPSIGVTPRLGTKGLMSMIREQSFELLKLDPIQRILRSEAAFAFAD